MNLFQFKKGCFVYLANIYVLEFNQFSLVSISIIQLDLLEFFRTPVFWRIAVGGCFWNIPYYTNIKLHIN